ncbi:MAG: hypothetical protein ACN6OA_04090 [Acinetobacter baumannii]
MNKNVVVFSCSVAALILTILLFCILGILFFYWGDYAAVKDSLSTIGGIFGGITTIGAAVIAAYLFNDWKIQHNKSIEVQLSLLMIEKFEIFDEQITSLYGPIGTAYDLGDHELMESAVNDFKQHRQKKLLEIRISFLKVSAAIENCSLFSGDIEEVKNQLKSAKSAFRKFSNTCMNIKKDSSYNEFSTKFLLAFRELIPHINRIETTYIHVALKNLRA